MSSSSPLKDSSPAEQPQSGDVSSTLPSRKPLARKVLVAMTLRLMLVTIALTGAGYVHVMRAVTKQTMDGFEQYIGVKGARESELFGLAEDNHRAMRIAFVDALHEYGNRDPAAEFDDRYEITGNGTIVCRRDRFDATKHASCVSDPGMSAKLDADLRRRILSANLVADHFGTAYHSRFSNTWFTTYDGVGFMYWPEKPTFYLAEQNQNDSSGDDDYLGPASPEKNPERKIVWTKSYFDLVSKLVLVSITTPVYDGDRFLGTIGHDISIAQLLERTLSERLEGTYNVLLRHDGFLIAHPHKMEELAKANGAIDVMKSSDLELRGIYLAASTSGKDVTVVESHDGKNYLGISKISGPNWFLASVYPKALVQDTAWSTARFILLGGLLSLVIELVLFYGLLKTRVTAPLDQLRQAIAKVAAGERTVKLDTSRDDELGELAASFQAMAEAVQTRENAQREAEQAVVVLNQELAQNLEREKERNQRLLTLQREVDDLSTPVLEVAQHVLALPIIGVLDATRGRKIMERLLEAVVAKRAEFVILDVTGAHDIDRSALEQLLQVIAAIRLLGAKCVLTGVRPSVAQAMVSLDASVQSVETLRTLGQALDVYLRRVAPKRR